MKRFVVLLSVLLLLGVLILFRSNTFGFGEIAGACEPDCQKCHTLTKKEAFGILNAIAPGVISEVIDVRLSPVRGLWEVDIKLGQGPKDILYIDFSKGKIIQGIIIDVKEKVDITSQRRQELMKVDVSTIPLDEALQMGETSAGYKVIVFSDPE
ncbi:MAG: hypothetical protein HY805_00105 [Nitrospirae bacterium]|nr:hypothetical protein [Nitrospirota bacterium]